MTRRVAVVGGGVIGLFCAYYLRRGGAEVVVVERGEPGCGCSAGNAGWVVPSISTPLPAPGLRTRGLRWLLRHDSPLYLSPSAAPTLLPWLLRFWRACNEQTFARGAAALVAHATEARQLYRELAEVEIDFEWHSDGLLMAFRSEAALDEERALIERFGGGSVRQLSADELLAAEPHLAGGRGNTGARLVGGLLVTSEAHVRPESLTEGLAARCRALGVELRTGFGADRFVLEAAGGRRRARELDGPGGALAADDFVLATGAELGRLARQCGTPLPIQAGKGYSLTVEQPELDLARPLYLAESKVGLTPFRGGLRIAGTLELSGINLRLDRHRLAVIEQAAEAELPGITRGSRRSEWVGMRPLTPDGLPVIGRLPGTDNVWVAGGHQMLGITLAPASGRALAGALLASDESAVEADREAFEAFAPGRFRRTFRGGSAP